VSEDDDGWSDSLLYNIYIDDGNDGAFSLVDTTSSLQWNSDNFVNGGSITLTEGQIYKARYSAENSYGESDLSDEVSILLASEPD
jgi:hypothetical protein